MLSVDKETIARQLGDCIWDFKIGDNIAFNLKVLYALYSVRETNINHVFNKPIVVFLVSLIEALLVDLLYHLDGGTNDLPTTIPAADVQAIKTRIYSQKIQEEKINPLNGSTYVFYKIKNYNFKEILNIFQDFSLLGAGTERIYKDLETFAWLRNRIHIPNYHNNFERDEATVFTDNRVIAIEQTFISLLDAISTKYPRKILQTTKDSNARTWLTIFA